MTIPEQVDAYRASVGAREVKVSYDSIGKTKSSFCLFLGLRYFARLAKK